MILPNEVRSWTMGRNPSALDLACRRFSVSRSLDLDAIEALTYAYKNRVEFEQFYKVALQEVILENQNFICNVMLNICIFAIGVFVGNFLF